MSSEPRRARTWPALLSGAIVLFALLLRLTGIDRQLPHRPEPDAFFVQSLQEYEGDPTLIRSENYLTRYPSLIPRVLSFLPYPELPVRASGAGSEAVHLEAAAWPYLRVRTAIALVSTLGVALLWFLARRFLSPAAALAATFLLATSLLSILFAQQGRPHTPQAVMALMTVLASLRVLERPTLVRIAVATLAGALAAACLQNGLIALAPLSVAIFLGCRAARGRGLLLPLAVAGLAALAAAAFAVPFYPGLPYIDSSGLHMGGPDTRAHNIPLDLGNAAKLVGLREAARVLWAHDPVLLVLGGAGALAGIVVLVRRWRTIGRARRLELLVLGAYVVPYLVVLAPNPFVFERFLLPMLPYLALLAGWVVAGLADFAQARVRSRGLAAAAGAFVVALCLAPPAYVAVRYDQVAKAPDKLELAAQWIRANVDPASVIATSPSTALPLLLDPEFLRIDLEDRGAYTLAWLAYQGALPAGPDPERRWRVRVFPSAFAVGKQSIDPAAVEPWLRDTGADYLVMEASRYMRKLPPTAALEDAGRRLGELVYHSTGQMPSIPGLGSGEYQAASAFAFWLPRAEAFGPDIDIYRLRRNR
jgi:hypothetical protein